jgi:hypothetical protein
MLSPCSSSLSSQPFVVPTICRPHCLSSPSSQLFVAPAVCHPRVVVPAFIVVPLLIRHLSCSFGAPLFVHRPFVVRWCCRSVALACGVCRRGFRRHQHQHLPLRAVARRQGGGVVTWRPRVVVDQKWGPLQPCEQQLTAAAWGMGKRCHEKVRT